MLKYKIENGDGAHISSSKLVMLISLKVFSLYSTSALLIGSNFKNKLDNAYLIYLWSSQTCRAEYAIIKMACGFSMPSALCADLIFSAILLTAVYFLP